ncbi:tRNA (adenosine(37)-N6)-threonylcarbamoyltransferase complex dimerization subunit type 1 TsaB [Mesorhizobium sp. J428]|uniref:tRNA (adenosine(37)-N6)-threonylcarbamoyltransferase complex dimerization subunit type 1 TsaB n=1 Tax=Mesorhizobium sp. J428 TaxID=2898440 RepID=UPI002151CC31|nr:tRNA (adenosine(37)-N6)-threonylcarbamoyltransferase complex dimerization subunit type 1 TsaB [Mesorhizobium sp. J428]MCR5857707.1 tRNA (adenosine(37)-N6)-threonylcarbamoyltransferase complex dimerization subunit type 1 TsaB [Mesorhizobium sp. J428]
MILLAIDTASSLCAACVFDAAAGRELGRAVEDIGKGHAERLMDVIAEALAAAGKIHADLGAVAVSIGPGSFTGIRVGVAAARGLALGLRVPAHGITTLSAIAEEARDTFPGCRIVASIDAKRDEIYVEDHAADGSITHGPSIVPVDQASALLDGERPVLAGSGAAVIAAGADPARYELAGGAATADIAVYARLAAAGRTFNSPPKPLYLRGPDARPQDGFALPRRAT